MTPISVQHEEEFGLGDKRVELNTFDRYKGRKGVTDRIAIISSGLIRAHVHFQTRSFRCLSSKEKQAICCEQLGQPQQKFGLTLFVYATDQNGEMLDKNKCSGKVMLWLISEARYEELSTLNKNWPLLDKESFAEKQHDVIAKCTEEQFQRMQFTPTPDAQWKKKEIWYKAVKEKERKAKERLKIAIGRQLKEEEVRELLGQVVAVAPGSTDNAGAIDLSDVLDEA